MDETHRKNYVANTPTSKGRNIRIEVVGDITKTERDFIEGLRLFLAGTLSKDDQKHLEYVAGMMSRLITCIVLKLKRDKKRQKGT